jgi:hypothetical protein
MKVEDTKKIIPFDFQRAFTLVLSECLKIQLCRSKYEQQDVCWARFSQNDGCIK